MISSELPTMGTMAFINNFWNQMILIFYVQTCVEVSGNIFSKCVLKMMNVKSKAGCVMFWLVTLKLKSMRSVGNQFKKKKKLLNNDFWFKFKSLFSNYHQNVVLAFLMVFNVFVMSMVTINLKKKTFLTCLIIFSI